MKYFTLFLLFLSTRLFSQNYQQLDSIKFSPRNGVWGLEHDSVGNIYMAGYFGRADHDNTSKSGIYIKKYGPSGNIIWWDTACFKWVGRCAGLVLDRQGNSILLGICPGNNNSIKFGPYQVTSGSIGSLFLVKFSPQGVPMWARSFPGYGGMPEIAIDNYDYVYVEGQANTNSQIDSYTVSGGFIAKFDANGTCVNALSNSSSQAYTITCDGENIFFGETINSNLTYLRKYDSSLTQIWAISFTDAGPVKADKNGNCYMRGAFFGCSTYFGNIALYNPYCNAGRWQTYAGKIDKDGNCLWAFTPTDSLNIMGMGISDDAFYVTGYSDYPSGGNFKLFLEKHDTNGTFISENKFTRSLVGRQITCIGSTDVFIAGEYQYQNPPDFLSKVSFSNLPTTVNNHQNSSSLTLAPNPASGIFQLNYSASRAGTVTLNILNAKGQLLSSEKIKTEGEIHRTLDLSTYAKGVYFIELVNGEAREVKRVVLQ
jgi:hypothetical protein